MKTKQEKPRTYSLEGFRAELEGDAQKRCDAQAETIRKLMEENKALRERIDTLVNSQLDAVEMNRLRMKRVD